MSGVVVQYPGSHDTGGYISIITLINALKSNKRLISRSRSNSSDKKRKKSHLYPFKLIHKL